MMGHVMGIMMTGCAAALLPMCALAAATAGGEMRQDPAGGLVVADCMVNGKSARMIVDTGASCTVLDETFAAGLPGLVRLQVPTKGNARLPHYPAACTVEAGGARFENTPAVVLSLAGVNAVLKQPVQGILGMDTLGTLPFTLDYAAGKFRWGAPGDGRARIAPEQRLDALKRPYLLCRSGANRQAVLLDTGSSVTLLETGFWAPGAAGSEELRVADVQSDRTDRIQRGKAGELVLAEGVTASGLSPRLLTPGERPGAQLGADALRNTCLQHIPAPTGKPSFFFLLPKP